MTRWGIFRATRGMDSLLTYDNLFTNARRVMLSDLYDGAPYFIGALVVALYALHYYRSKKIFCWQNLIKLSFLIAVFNALIIVPTGYFAFILVFVLPFSELILLLWISRKLGNLKPRHSLLLVFFSLVWCVCFYIVNLVILQSRYPKG